MCKFKLLRLSPNLHCRLKLWPFLFLPTEYFASYFLTHCLTLASSAAMGKLQDPSIPWCIRKPLAIYFKHANSMQPQVFHISREVNGIAHNLAHQVFSSSNEPQICCFASAHRHISCPVVALLSNLQVQGFTSMLYIVTDNVLKTAGMLVDLTFNLQDIPSWLAGLLCNETNMEQDDVLFIGFSVICSLQCASFKCSPLLVVLVVLSVSSSSSGCLF